MQFVENEIVEGKVIILDDKHFVNGVYTKCTVVYGGGDFSLTNTKFKDCRVNLTGAAQRTANLLGQLGLTKAPPPPISPEHRPVQ